MSLPEWTPYRVGSPCSPSPVIVEHWLIWRGRKIEASRMPHQHVKDSPAGHPRTTAEPRSAEKRGKWCQTAELWGCLSSSRTGPTLTGTASAAHRPWVQPRGLPPNQDRPGTAVRVDAEPPGKKVAWHHVPSPKDGAQTPGKHRRGSAPP